MFSMGIMTLKAQEAIPASGGDAAGSGGTASYTVGQMVYSANYGSNTSESQGVQQAYVIIVENGVDVAKNISLQCSAYPNPTSDFLNLKIDGTIQTNYVAYLYDASGKLLFNKKIDSNETSIPMAQYVSGTYFLKLADTSSKELKTFKIIKK
jgi:hypothetical protein